MEVDIFKTSGYLGVMNGSNNAQAQYINDTTVKLVASSSGGTCYFYGIK